MFSFSFSTLLAFLLLYVPSATIVQLKKAWEDPAPCQQFYDKGQKGKILWATLTASAAAAVEIRWDGDDDGDSELR